MALKFDTFREGEANFPPFEPDKSFAVEFLKTVLDSIVGTYVTQNATLSEAVVVQRLFCGKEAEITSSLFGAHSGLTAAQRVPTPHPNTVKRLWAVLTRKAVSKGFGGKRAGGLLEAFRVAINQKRYEPRASN
eukprot:6173126-Pleurochrysis_carterae.AAC.1